jgi:ActD protein
MSARPPVYGLLAEFSDPNELIAAARRAREAGYRDVDAYTPFPIEELGEALGFHYNRLPLVVLIGGIVGALAGLGLQYWTAVIDYPINVGGRPLFSLPSFIPITFETTVLVAALSAVLGMLALNGLPMPYHPVFNVPRFALATRDRFFLCIEATDPLFDREDTRRFLERQTPREVSEVEQ